MATVRELVNGGVVTNRDATLLREGEVQQADDCILKPGDPALHKAPGRTAYGTVSSTSVSTTTNGTTTLTSSAAFGTDIASCTTTINTLIVTSSAAFGSVVAGMAVYGTGIASGSRVKRVVSTSEIHLDKNATASGTVTLTVSNYHNGTFISGTGITVGTTISFITNASSLTMSAAASDSTTTSRTFSEAVKGVEYLGFDSEDKDLIIATANDKLYYSNFTANTGTFTSLLTGLTADGNETLDTVQYGGAHYVLTGRDRPKRVFYSGGADGETPTVVARTAGMVAVTDGTFTAGTVPGTWTSNTDFGAGFYYFLVTEVVNPDAPDEIESTFEGSPKGIQIVTVATEGVRINRLATGATTMVNDGLEGRNTATHWRIYMSPRQTSLAPAPDLSTFRRMFTVNAATTSFLITDTNPQQAGDASAVTTYGGYLGFDSTANMITTASATSVVCNGTIGGITLTAAVGNFSAVFEGMPVIGTGIPNDTRVLQILTSTTLYLDRPLTSSFSSTTTYFGNIPAWNNSFGTVGRNTTNFKAGEFGNFGIQNQGSFSSGTITGIKVQIKGGYSVSDGTDRGLYISLRRTSGGGATSGEVWVKLNTKTSSGTGYYTAGGPGDTWGISWVPADFTNTNVFVRVRQASSAVSMNHNIDGVRITIYAGGNTINLDGDPFRTVLIPNQIGDAVGVGAAGEPPIASTGDVFDGMMVLNDTSDPSSVVGSLPDEPESFPGPYRLTFESKSNDIVKVIRRVGNTLIIGCLNSVKRLNYFPTEDDAQFSQGRAHEDLTTDHGMVGPRAAVTFDIPGRGPVLAYVSYNGVHWTDGVTTDLLNEDLDWENTVSMSNLTKCVLRAYPKYYLLALYYTPTGGTRNTKVIYFSYHPIHMKGNKLPAVGPVTCTAASASTASLAGVPYLITGHGIDGKVYVEDSGTTDDSGGTIAPTIKTRRVYAANIGGEARVQRIFLRTDAAGNSTTGGLTVTFAKQNQGEAYTDLEAFTGMNTVVGGLLEGHIDNIAESFDIKIAKTSAQTAAFRLHFIGYEGFGYGEDETN